LPNLLQSQLSFFGAIDEAVLYAQRGEGPNPEAVLRIVETLLPGTTGFAQAGWYRELEAFANRDELAVGDLRSLVRFPTVAEALRLLQASPSQPLPGLAAAFSDGAEPSPSGSEEPAGDTYDPKHDPGLARSAFAAAILARIARLGGLPPELEVTRTMPTQIMAAAVSLWQGSTTRLTARQAASDPQVSGLFSRLDEVDSRDDWQRLAAEEVEPLFADQSLPCVAKLDNVDGQYVSTLYTDATDMTLTVKNLEKIIDPRNWTIACSFFCAVKAQEPPYTRRGWSRILEAISPEPEKWCLKTALVFYYARDSEGGIFLNYDLDPHRQDDSGIVEVDKGYIWITPLGDPSKKGIRIQTSKQERVQGLSPTATAALASVLGWGDAAYKLLAGTAKVKSLPAGTIVHRFYTTAPKGYESKVDHTPPQGPDPGGHPKLPPNFGTAVGDARDLLNDLINRTRNVGADAANRWLDGVSRDDVMKITDGVGTNLREFMVEMYDTAEDSVKPKDMTTVKGRR
jgi:hypothetical protein